MPDFRDDIRARLASLRIVPAREADVVDELAQHLEDEYQERIAAGATDSEARTAAVASLTDELDAMRSTGRVRGVEAVSLGNDATGSRWNALRVDLGFALRLMRAKPGLAIAATLLLALGIGATATTFSVVNTVLLKPLPFARADQLISYWGTAPERGLPRIDLPDGVFSYHREQTKTLQSVAIYDDGSHTLTGDGEPDRVNSAWTAHNLFTVLGVAPAIGRTFTRDEERPNGGLVVILSDALWRTRYAADSGIVGRSIRVNDLPTTVIGVMPPGFEFPNRARLWVPLRLTGQSFDCWCFATVGRLADGRTVEDARGEIARLTDDLALTRRDIFPDAKPGGSRIVVMPLATKLAGDIRTPLYVLLASVGLVMFIGCANVANLMLARAAQRDREIAVRCALGASPKRVRAQLLTEAGLMLAFGLVVGLTLTWWSLSLIRSLPADRIPRIDEVALDPMVLVFGLGAALLAGLVVALAPALRASRVDLQGALRDGARGSGGAGSRLTSDVFVVVQLALSLVLLSGAGLLVRSFRNLMEVETGYQVEHVLTARISLPYQRYPNDTLNRQFFQRATEAITVLPGVTHAGATSQAPLAPGNHQNNIAVEGYVPRPNEPTMVANIRFVTPGYFAAIGTPIVRGRGFTQADGPSAPLVAVVDESVVNRYWPGQDPLGKRVRFGGGGSSDPWLTVVGVTPNIKHTSLDEDASLQVYQPYDQRSVWSMYLVVRSTGAPEQLVPALRQAIAGIDPSLPLFSVTTMERALARSLMPRRLTNGILTGFAATALLLAAIGIYGVMSLNVNGRIREFGVRLALGADPRQVMRMVLRGGARLALAGVALGTVAAALLTPLLRDLLFGVAPHDVLTFVGVALLLMTFALLACFIPARRAMRADPTEALRAD